MNILMFTRCMGEGGTEKIIIQLCEILLKANCGVYVCADGGKSEKTLCELGVKYYKIPDMQIKTPMVTYEIIKTIGKILQENKIDIIHVHHRMAAFYCQIMRLNKKYKMIATSHNTFHDKLLFTKLAYRNFHLVACGEKVKCNLETEYNIKDVKVIHNAIRAYNATLHIYPELKADKENGYFMVANIGRINEQKGMEYFVRAYQKVWQKHKQIKFYIIGTGVQEEEIKQLAIKEKADVQFMGYRTDIQNIIAQMDLIVLSSLWEGFPLTPIETFSMGKTMVATDVDGTSEIIQDGINGCLVKPKDSDQLAEKICWMIEHPEQKTLMEKEALRSFINKFSIDVFAQKYLDLYRSI